MSCIVQQLNDSSLIISALESFLLDQTQSVPQLVSYYPELESENERGKKVYEYPNKYFLMHGKEAALTDKRKYGHQLHLSTLHLTISL